MLDDLFDAAAALRPLRPDQESAIEALRQSLATRHRCPLLQGPTGIGKTKIAAEIIRRARAKGKRVAFVVPKVSLIDQTIQAFAAEGIRWVGVLQGAHPLTDADQPVQVISAQTLARRARPAVDLVLVDEAHEMQRRCPGCGVVVFTKTDVRTADGELVEFGSHRTGKLEATIEDKASFHGELKWIARERGRGSRWIANSYRERFGVWPNDWRIRSAEPRPPSIATRNWVKSRAIAWAKSRGAVANG